MTRSASKMNLGEELIGQITSRPIALAMAGTFLVALLFTPLPKGPLTILALSCGLLAWVIHQNRPVLAAAQARAAKAKAPPKERVESYRPTPSPNPA